MLPKRRFLRDTVFIIISIWIVATLIDRLGWVESIEMKTVDARFRLRHHLKKIWDPVHVSNQIVLVAVDQKSVDPSVSPYSDRWGSGGWLTRDHWISAIYYLANFYKPSVIGYDIEFLPYRTQSRQQKSSTSHEAKGIAIDQYLHDHKSPIRDLILEEAFPKLELLDLLDEACATGFANMFYDVDDARMAGKRIPYFISPFVLNQEKVDATKPWDLSKKEDLEKISQLKRRALPLSCILNIPSDYPFADNASLPFHELAEAPVPMGYINVPRDADGIIRRIPLVYGFRDHSNGGGPVFIPSLALQACLLFFGIDPHSSDTGITVILDKEIHLWNPKQEIHIPVDRYGNLFLNFEGKIDDFLSVPYVDIPRFGEILQSERNRSLPDSPQAYEALKIAHEIQRRLDNKIAIIGLTFTGAGETEPCAIDPNTPSVFIHMTAIDNILRGDFLKPLSPGATLGILLLELILVGALNAYTPARISALGTVLIVIGGGIANFILFSLNIYIVPMILPGLSVLITFGAVSLYRYQTEWKQRLEVRKKFSTMVSDSVLRYMESHPESFSLRGEKREATMFFSDISGFTRMSEQLPPDQLSQILNDYLTPMTELIQARDGYVNKYAGDGIMAVWGIPYPRLDHALQACLSALDQQKKIQEMKRIFRDKYGLELKVRMGLNSGVVSAGNMGSRDRFEYTVMGDEVNLAARLEPANKDYGTFILVGEKTQLLVKTQLVTRFLDRIVVEGKTTPISVYELVEKRGEIPAHQMEALELFEQGLFSYWKRDWDHALKTFQKVLQILTIDPPSEVFIRRAKNFQIHPPPPEWGGECVRQHKN